MVLEYIITSWDAEEPKSYNSEIYTDWANHYLEKSRNKKFISDLQQDISDGVLLADVIEAVTNDKIKDIKLKPKNSAQMVDNINACLNFLSGLGVSVDGISAKDIKEGNLKAILGLFFSLSRYKQQQKSQQASQKSAEQCQDRVAQSSTSQQNHVDTAATGHSGHTGHHAAQLNGGEMLSRLPSPFKNNKNTSSSSTTKDTQSSGVNNVNNVTRSKTHAPHSTSNEKAKSHQNLQNNILQVSSTSNSKNNNTSRATSPGHHSGIPTPGGKAIPTARSQSAAEKQLNRTSASSTSSTSSTKSNPAKPQNKNSMLDKFKFFNSKDKDKKGGAVKGTAKTNGASSNTSKSESDSNKDTKSSTSPRSSIEVGGPSSSSNGANSPKLPAKTGKKSLVRAFSTKRETPKTLAPEDTGNGKKRNTPSPGSIQPRTPSPNTNNAPVSNIPGAPPPVPKTSPPPSRKTAASKSDKSEKSSKGSTLIPKSASSSGKSKSAASTPTSSQIPAPNFSMSKSGKSSKSSKEEKSKNSVNGKEHSKALFSSLPGVNAHKSLGSKSSSVVSSPASTPDGNGGMLSRSNSSHSGIQPAPKSSQEYSSSVIAAQHSSRVQAQENTYYRAVEHSANIANPHSNAHAPTDHMNMNMTSKSSRTPKSQIVIPSARGQHGGSTMTQTVNVVKPQCTMPSSRSVSKADGNTQTNLSVMQKTAVQSKYAVTRDSSNHSVHSEVSYSKPSDSAFSNRVASPVTPQGQTRAIIEHHHHEPDSLPSSESSHHVSTSLSSSQSSASTSVSSNDSVVLKPGLDSSAYDRLYSGSSNSPRLGVKMLGKPNNVAIVQPRHGEKIETTFDKEVRTETVNKPSPGKETTFSEKSTTFVDDCGETMDIKPMPPIMRALPYGYFRGYTGYTGLSSSRNFHIPGISVPPTQAMYASSTSRLGVNRPILEHGKFYSGQIKRSGSNCPNVQDPDYASDVDTYDYVSGYMSDGDILKSNNRVDDWSSGYMSEGGASLYARRLQQRFREGMQAVKECMQKSSGVIDDDSFDDSSSISSGDISDTIAEISTDENLTGSSHGALSETNPYSSLKRGPKDLTQGIQIANGHGRIQQGKRPNLGTSAFLGGGGEYNNDANSSPYGWGRKYYLPQNSKLLSSDPSDYAYPYSNCDQHSQWGRSEPSYGSLRKLSNSSQSDFGYRVESPQYAGSDKGTYSPTPSVKCDSTTNTDQSHLMETSLKRMQTARGAAPSNGSGTGIQYRRPLSNVSNSSGGSNKSNGSNKGSTAVGSRLAKHGVDNGTPTGIPRPGSAAAKISLSTHSDMSHDAYASSTLERKKKGLTTSKSSSNTAATPDFQSNTLGRRRLFDSKSSLTKGSNGSENGSMCPSTIISNPHATYGKGVDFKGQQSHYVNLQQLQAMQQCTLQQHGPASGNYITLEYSSPRNSGNNWLMRNGNGVMSETESMDSISSATSLSIQAQIQQARALSGASARILAQQRDQNQNQNQNQGLQRSDSIKSSHSDVPHAHSTSLSEDLPRTNSFSHLSGPCNSAAEQLASPTSAHASSRFTYPMTFTSGMPSSLSQHMVHSNTHHGMTFNSLPLSKVTRDEDGISRLTKSSTIDYAYLSDYAYSSVHGSNLSLISSASSVHSSAEERQQYEIRKLRRELEGAQDKVLTLSNQLNTNSHVVAAFEQSLSNMTSRLQALTLTAEQKDSELNELRHTIEALKRQSGLSVGEQGVISPNSSRRHTSPGVVIKEGHPHQRHVSESGIMRQMSSDSMSSINSLSSACSVTSQQSAATDSDSKGKKKKGWLRSSFSKAFNRKKNKNGSMSDVEPDTQSLRSNISAPNSPLLLMHGPPGGPLKGSHSSGALCETDEVVNVVDLKQQLREKDMKLTDIRLEALSSAHQLEQLRETMNKMKSEMSALKCDNERLNRTGGPLTTPQHQRALHISQSSLSATRSNDSLDRSISLTDHSSLDMLLAETAANDREGKRVTLAMYLGSNPDPTKEGIEKPAEVLIGSLSVSGKTKWDILDNMVRKIFKEYVLRVDPVTNLGLSSESLHSYHVGEIFRTKDSELPELLPIGYLVGETMQIGICLKGTKQNTVDSLSFETMIPKSIIQRYVQLLLEHRRIILCGPSGTGKSYLAQKLAEHLVLRSGRILTAGSVATFNVDHKSSKELRLYLSNIAEQCENTIANELPGVIILDNLHHVNSLADVFNGFLSVKYQKCPYIIGTMNQQTCNATNLQLHHNFRWVLCANHMEPVKGFLGRYLRRKLVEAEVRTGIRNNDLNKIIDWIPKVWAHLNKFLETHSSSDITIGPRLFLSCPMDIAGSQVWFTDLWNYSLVPYMLEAVRDGLQVYGKRAPWDDPSDWVIESYPWCKEGMNDRALLKMRPEDVGYDSQTSQTTTSPSSTIKTKTQTVTNPTDGDGDPLVNMLMRLQEAANYSSPHSNDSDSTSLDSHSSIQEFSGSSGVESTL